MMMAPDDAALRASIGEICRALAVDASLAQTDDLADFLSLLQKWNATYNLTAVRDPAQMLVQHLADCLAVITPLRRRLAELGDASPRRLLDVGSGGGLPGAVVAIMQPGLDVTCVDTVGKKAAFTRQVAGELTLRNLHAEHARVEQLAGRPFDVITSRAFASLPDFVNLTRKLLAPDGVWLAMKGKHPEAEIAGLPADVTVFHVEQLEVPGLKAERCLIWMRPSA
ncbi:16S rRNA (guanine(527)-N(7))-methyltransferase RsmG [soil metagenome]